MQCVPCHPCRPQFNPVFDPTKSLTFHHVPANDGVLCHARYKPWESSHCEFHIGYRSSPTPASGYLAKETFSFLKGNNEGGLEQLRSIVFGCAHHTAEFDNQNILAGVLGLGMWKSPINPQTRSIMAKAFASPTARSRRG